MQEQKPPSKDTLLFIHIPKTAGTTFQDVAKRHFRVDQFYSIYSPAELGSLRKETNKDRLRLVMGHFRFGLHQYFDYGCQYFTFLRNPVEQVLSFYNHMLNSSDKDHKKVLEHVKSLHGYASHPWARNLQTCYVTNLMYDEIERDPESALLIAKDNLRRYFLGIGIVERFDESLLFLKYRLNWGKIYYRRLNITSRKKQYLMLEEVEKDTLELIKDNNQCDQALYDFANELLDQQLASVPHFSARLKKFYVANKGFQLICKIKNYLQERKYLDKKGLYSIKLLTAESLLICNLQYTEKIKKEIDSDGIS